VCSLFVDLFSLLLLRNPIRVCTRSTDILPYYRTNIDRRTPMRVILYILCPVGYGCVANNYVLQDEYCAFIVVVFCFGFFFHQRMIPQPHSRPLRYCVTAAENIFFHRDTI